MAGSREPNGAARRRGSGGGGSFASLAAQLHAEARDAKRTAYESGAGRCDLCGADGETAELIVLKVRPIGGKSAKGGPLEVRCKSSNGCKRRQKNSRKAGRQEDLGDGEESGGAS